MRKQLAIYYASFVVFFLLISLARGWFSTSFIVFWIGGAIGAILPDIDHFIYVYYLKPHELTSQRATHMMRSGKLLSTYSLLARTRSERTNLIFHTILFQLIFLAFTFFVISSSNSLFGKGLTLAFSLHLVVDQFLDFQQLGSISHWFKNLNVSMDKNRTIFYWTAASLVIVVLGFIF